MNIELIKQKAGIIHNQEVADPIANDVNETTGQERSDRQRVTDAGGGNVFDFM